MTTKPKAYIPITTWFKGNEPQDFYFVPPADEIDNYEKRDVVHEIEVMYWGSTVVYEKTDYSLVPMVVTCGICRVKDLGRTIKADPEAIMFDPEIL